MSTYSIVKNQIKFNRTGINFLNNLFSLRKNKYLYNSISAKELK